MAAVTVIGSGSWGTALAVHLGAHGHDVRLWARSDELVAEMAASRFNRAYLPDVELPAAVRPTARLEDATADASIVVFAVPSHGLRQVVRAAVPGMARDAVLVSAVKGIEQGTLLRMSEVIAQEEGSVRRLVVLSGPSFALEVAHGLPTAVIVGSAHADAAAHVQQKFRGRAFRIYATDDVVGVEVGGALKNVIAIAAGVSDALGLGHNALAALITRGLAEISRLACALGGRQETLAGLSGLGDLALTCTGGLSRNRHLGMALGRGRSLHDIVAATSMIAEGVRTTDAALALGRRHGIELPIAEQMEAVLYHAKEPRAACEALMLRPQRSESEPAGADPCATAPRRNEG